MTEANTKYVAIQGNRTKHLLHAWTEMNKVHIVLSTPMDKETLHRDAGRINDSHEQTETTVHNISVLWTV